MNPQPAIRRIRKIQQDIGKCLWLSDFDQLIIESLFARHIREFEEEAGVR